MLAAENTYPHAKVRFREEVASTPGLSGLIRTQSGG